MRAINLNDVSHYCGACGRTYRGSAAEYEVICCDEEAGTPIENVCTTTRYRCNDPRGACDLSEDEINIFDEAWQCGECQNIHSDVASAITCCT